jgi:peptide/nickel transport system substrate-binding protein
VKKTNKSAKALAFVAAASLIVAACGDDDDDGGDTTATTAEADTATTEAEAEGTETTEAEMTETTEAEAEGTETTEAEGTETTEGEASTEAEMTVTYTLSDVAVWNDGTPFSAADFECLWNAKINTPESIDPTGYDRIVSVTEGATPQEVVVGFSPPFAAYKTLFNTLLKADAHADCNDVSTDFPAPFEYGAGPYMMTEWTAEQQIWEKNPGYIGERTGGPDRIVVTPQGDPVALQAGEVDFIFPQAYTGIDAELESPNIEWAAEPGGQYEGIYFQQDTNCVPSDNRSCAFADPIYRQAFSMSIDIEGVYEQIYAPFAQGTPLLNCGPIAPGDYCDPVFGVNYDPEAAAALLEENGWTMNADGQWVNADGEAPEVHFMVSAPNARREGTQQFLIPRLIELGFNVIADNCEALPCVFQNRLPALEYDMSMFINTVAPDPVYVSSFTCDQIPSEENNFQGFNNFGWCNPDADVLFEQADQELDPAARAALVKEAIALMADDYALIPTLQFPNVGAYRSDRVAGTQENLANYWAFKDWWNFEDVDGDGQVVIGANQYATPDCTNPITDCAGSSWYQWIAGFPTFPAVYDTTNDQQFVPSEFLTGEAVVEVM